MGAMEDKCNHLNKVKAKLEVSLDECEDALEREKKSKGDVEKMKRKIEGDLKLTQEAVSDLERVRSELQQTLMRKEKELSSVGAKIEDEHTLGSKYTKQIKELQGRIDELDEELVIERQARAKAEKDKAAMERDLMDTRQGLDEAMRERANMERNCKMTQGLIVEANTKLDELARALNESDSTKKKLQVKAQDL